MTALDEGPHLAEAVASVFAQDYPGRLELVVAVGPSRDNTLELARGLAAENPRLRVLVNPTGRTPAGLNIALAGTDPETAIVVRTDGHAQLPPDYVRRAVSVLLDTGAANVGGMMIPEGVTAFESAVARAMSRRIGLGAVAFHVGGEPGPAPTVYLGVFRRDVLDKTGGFDERFTRAQDWELNYRIRELGEVVWFEPGLQVRYRPRPNLRRLAQQFRGSGLWRWQIIRTYPDTVSVRYLAAPLTTVAIGLAGTVLVVDAALVHSAAVAVAAASVPAGYLAVVLLGAVATRRGLGLRSSLAYPAALVTMHLSWGYGFLTGPLGELRQRLVGRRGTGSARRVGRA